MGLRSRLAAALVPLICFVCPIVELFDRWDKTPQTGNDTEFVFVILALCFGAAWVLIRLAASGSFTFALERCHNFRARCSDLLASASRVPLLPLIPISPPGAALRI